MTELFDLDECFKQILISPNFLFYLGVDLKNK